MSKVSKAHKHAAKAKPGKVAKPSAAAKGPLKQVKPPARIASKAPPPPPPLSKDKPKPKGITIVNNKPMRRPKPKKVVVMPSLGSPLLGPGSAKKWKPLIPSGPHAPRTDHRLGHAKDDGTKPKSRLDRRELDRFRALLVRKRAELAGDVSRMEGDALQASSGSLSHLPQHMAEQGSEAYDQSLALDIASVDRSLIREIEDAIKRIDNGTFGICEMTGKPISKERLEELPWTRFSIEAARESERRSYRA